MRAKFSLLIIISYCLITFAQDVTIKGLVRDWKSGVPIPNAKIEFSKISNDIVTKDTIETTSSGLYTYTYLFELIKYKKKFDKFHVRVLDNNTHWFYTRKLPFTLQNRSNFNIIGISHSYPDSCEVSGYTTFLNSPLEKINVILTQTNEDSTYTKIDTLVTDSNGSFRTYVKIKEYKYFKLTTSSNKWPLRYNNDYQSTYWSNQLLDRRFDFRVNDEIVGEGEIDSTYVKISGRITINGQSVNTASLRFNPGIYIQSDYVGDFFHYVKKGWSGTIQLNTTYYIWESGSGLITFNNLQEDQTLNLTANKKTNTVNGHVYIEEGDSIESVYLTFDNGESNYAVTDSNGFYSVEIEHESPFQIKLYKKGYLFNPEILYDLYSVTDLTIDFTSTAKDNEKILLNGTINNNTRGGVDSVLVTFSGTGNGQCMTDINGNFSHLLRFDWSGTITPVKEGIIFDPPEIPITNLKHNTTISTTGTDTLTTRIINGKPVKLNKKIKMEFEIVIYDVAGRLIGKAKNIETAKLLNKNATGLYFYQRIVNKTAIKTKNILYIK